MASIYYTHVNISMCLGMVTLLVILRSSFSLHNSDGVTNLGIPRESLVFSDILITIYYVTGTAETMQCY